MKLYTTKFRSHLGSKQFQWWYIEGMENHFRNQVKAFLIKYDYKLYKLLLLGVIY